MVLRRGGSDTRRFELPALDCRPATDTPRLPADPPAAQRAELERAWQDGFARGLAEAREQARPTAERDALEAEILSIDELLESMDQRLAMFILAMSLEVSRLVLRRTVRVKPDLVLPPLREALRTLVGLAEGTHIHFHPTDAGLVRRFATADERLQLPWPLAEDETLAPGQCRLASAAPESGSDSERRWRQTIGVLAARTDWVDATDRKEHSVGPPHPEPRVPARPQAHQRHADT
jgi:flagellar assembly protein FliH